MGESSNKYITLTLSEEAFDALSDFATQKGVRIKTFARELLLDALDKYSENNANQSLAGQVFSISHQMGQKERVENLLKSLVIRFVGSDGDEEILAQIEKLCKLLEKDVDEVIDDYMSRALSPQLSVGEKMSQKETDAYHWLSQQIKPGGYYSVSEIEAKAKEHGLSSYYIKKAKRALNIRSVKVGPNWYWVHPDHSDNNTSQPDKPSTNQKVKP
ncbi:hypothetical protein D6817_02045 [Candidatus Pacearchaeota archaeon]|nr:MAG: hypothetical protein D6817_02045 [Candidatus Pacearchaeota archaeon]